GPAPRRAGGRRQPVSSWPPPAAARPRLAPCWNPASRFLIASADLAGPAGSPAPAGPDPPDGGRPAAPGTRFARGVRTGKPDVVTPLEAGARSVFAASQPLSAAAPQPSPTTAARSVRWP